MTLPGWESLESVKAIDSIVQIVTLVFWSLLVTFDVIAVAWKKRAAFFTTLALSAFALAVAGEIIHYKYDSRKGVLYEARETSLRTTYDQQLAKARDDAQRSASSADKAQQNTDAAKEEAAKAHALEQQANEQIESLKKRDSPRVLTQEQKEKFVAIMRTGKPHDITVWHAPDLESQTYADELFDALTAAGWTVKPPTFRVLQHSVPGIVIMIHDMKVPEPEAGLLQHALKNVGVDANAAGVEAIVAVGQIELWVGPKNAITSSSN
jgi:hypothetical protein